MDTFHRELVQSKVHVFQRGEKTTATEVHERKEGHTRHPAAGSAAARLMVFLSKGMLDKRLRDAHAYCSSSCPSILVTYVHTSCRCTTRRATWRKISQQQHTHTRDPPWPLATLLKSPPLTITAEWFNALTHWRRLVAHSSPSRCRCPRRCRTESQA